MTNKDHAVPNAHYHASTGQHDFYVCKLHRDNLVRRKRAKRWGVDLKQWMHETTWIVCICTVLFCIYTLNQIQNRQGEIDAKISKCMERTMHGEVTDAHSGSETEVHQHRVFKRASSSTTCDCEQKKPSKKCRKYCKKLAKAVNAAQYPLSINDSFVNQYLNPFSAYETRSPCKLLNEYGGEICRNYTLRTVKHNGTQLTLFNVAKWVNKATSPFSLRDGVFTAKFSGLHFVYAQMLFESIQKDGGVTIVQKRQTSLIDQLTCYQSSAHTPYLSTTCTIIGQLSLKKHDKIHILSLKKNTIIKLDKSTSYFGAFRLK